MDVNYLDFELKLTSHNGQYFGQVIESPAGESKRVRLHFPFKEEDYEKLLLQLELALARGTRRSRGPATKEEKILQSFGNAIFSAVFMNAPEIRAQYIASQRIAAERENVAGVRLKLRVEPSELAVLPWEYLYDQEKTDYICLHMRSPLVRYMETDEPVRALAVKGPLRVLGMIANPGGDWEHLDTEREKWLIDKAISPLQKAGKVHFEWVQGETGNDLLRKMGTASWNVFHFIGHGGIYEDTTTKRTDGDEPREGFIVLKDDQGQPKEVAGSDLKYLLEADGSLRLVVLNCCDSARGTKEDAFVNPAAHLVRSGVPAILAMQFPISDEAAVVLASGFYEALANNKPVDAAVTLARKQMLLKSRVEWGIPVLYMRARDGRIFATSEEPTSSSPPVFEDSGQDAKPGRATPKQGTPVPEDEKHVHESRPSKYEETINDGGKDAAYSVGLTGEIRNIDDLLHGFEETESGAVPSQAALDNLLDQSERILTGHSDESSMRAKFARAYSYRAKVYGRRNSFAKALSDIDHAITLQPDDGEHHWVRGLVLMLKGRAQNSDVEQLKAIDAFSTAITCSPQIGKYYNSRGTAYQRIGEIDQALKDLNKAIELDSGEAEYFYHRSFMKRDLKDRKGEIEDLQKASEMGHPKASIALAKAQFAQNFERGELV